MFRLFISQTTTQHSSCSFGGMTRKNVSASFFLVSVSQKRFFINKVAGKSQRNRHNAWFDFMINQRVERKPRKGHLVISILFFTFPFLFLTFCFSLRHFSFRLRFSFLFFTFAFSFSAFWFSLLHFAFRLRLLFLFFTKFRFRF